MKILWGVDLGGTKIEGVVVDADRNYETISRLRVPTEKVQGYDHIVDQVAKLIDLLKEDSGHTPTAIGFGTPGAVDPDTQVIKNSNTTQLLGKPFHQDLETRLGVPIIFANDANCFALAETKLGVIPDEVPNAQVVFGVILGTGVGGGIVVNGKVLNGRHAIAGEWGHNFLDESGGESYSGLHGNVETILAGPSLEKWYHAISGETRKLREIIERHRQGIDPHATETFERMIHFFGKALGPIVNILDPDAIVLGGGVGNVDELYTLGPASVEKYVFNPVFKTPILRPKLGDSAGVFGAAMLVE